MDLKLFETQTETIEEALNSIASSWPSNRVGEAMRYSLFNGGKRFRPLLSILLAESLGVSPKKVLPWACAIELIHTYSLIHDDLPCMDNDDFRRGKPTNHKMFGEAIALLAGDALISEAFKQICLTIDLEKTQLVSLTMLLADSIGPDGMVGGQAEDIMIQSNFSDVDQLLRIHGMKTGKLISASLLGVSIIAGLYENKVKIIKQFADNFGVAFQIADDLQDWNQGSDTKLESIKNGSADLFTKILVDKTQNAENSIKELGMTEGPFFNLLKWNLDRGVANECTP